MEAFRLQPPPAVGIKAKAIQQAQEFEEIVAEKSRRSGVESPPYDFIELIGKGSFGRVFKGYVRLSLYWIYTDEILERIAPPMNL
jgi:hypothetical protein